VSRPSLVILAAGRARRFGGVKPLAPIGAHGEAVIDLIAGDAIHAGFDKIVLVINPDTGPLIQDHVSLVWPKSVNVDFAIQERPMGTVHAVLAAQHLIDHSAPFAVSNADDLYGAEAFRALAAHLIGVGTNALVGFRLSNALVGDEPVTRGVCDVGGNHLDGIAERRHVVAVEDRFESHDGLNPKVLDPAALVSMNLWGFAPAMWTIFDDAMSAATDASEEAEVLLPEVIGRVVSGDLAVGDQALRDITVLATDSRCVGVTHPGDLSVVQSDIAKQIERGERPTRPFDERT